MAITHGQLCMELERTLASSIGEISRVK